MTNERFAELMADDLIPLTEEEAKTWHFCPEFDGLLIERGSLEWETCCLCEDQHGK